jgi:pimeloyl-ACP methyl ester carboxylesterase
MRVTVDRPAVALAVDGEPIAYRVHGREAGALAPILTMHGLLSSTSHWPYFIDHYAARRPVISWEYRGHGGTLPPRDIASVTVEQFADDAHAVLAATGLAPAITVGLSFGVQVALEHYRRHPADVRALVLICGTYGHPLDRVTSNGRVRAAAAAMVRALGRREGIARRLLPIARTRLVRELAFLTGGAHREHCPPSVLDSLLEHVANLDPRVIGAITASYFEHSAEEVLPTVRVPTLIIAGDKDELTPVARAEHMARTIPNARLRVFPGHTHLVQVERPREVHEVIDDFLLANGL